MDYPQPIEYRDAILNLSQTLYDDELRKGVFVEDYFVPDYPLMIGGGGFACVFKVKGSKKYYAIRCWKTEIENIENRYKKIQQYLATRNLPYFVNFEYQAKGIVVNNCTYPILKMEWANALPLKEYINQNIKRKHKLQNLADNFVRMVTDLHYEKIAHGDLHDENIFVAENGQLLLIDYDGMYVPNLGDKKLTEGKAGYQHPNFKHWNELNEKMDYFSELIIYLSLLVIIDAPDYWAEVKDEGNRLLFSKKDLNNFSKSFIFKEIKQLSPKTASFANLLARCLKQSTVDELEPLEIHLDSWNNFRWNYEWECPKCDNTLSENQQYCSRCENKKPEILYRILLRDKVHFEELEKARDRKEQINKLEEDKRDKEKQISILKKDVSELKVEVNRYKFKELHFLTTSEANKKDIEAKSNAIIKLEKLLEKEKIEGVAKIQKQDIAISQLQTNLSFYQRKAKRLAIWRTIFLLAFIIALLTTYFIHF